MSYNAPHSPFNKKCLLTVHNISTNNFRCRCIACLCGFSVSSARPFVSTVKACFLQAARRNWSSTWTVSSGALTMLNWWSSSKGCSKLRKLQRVESNTEYYRCTVSGHDVLDTLWVSKLVQNFGYTFFKISLEKYFSPGQGYVINHYFSFSLFWTIY